MSRENRLLAAVVLVSIAVLLLLARFRFPAEDRPINPSPPPLERLAARGTFDDLASIVAQLQTRVSPALLVLRVVGAGSFDLPQSSRPLVPLSGETARSRLVLAARVRDDLALARIAPGDRIEAVIDDVEATSSVVAVDPVRAIGLVRISSAPTPQAPVVWDRERSGASPRYVTVAEATEGGPVLRPIFLARTDPIRDPRWDRPLLALGGAGVTIPGSFVFSLDGRLEGLTTIEENLPVVVPTEALLAVVNELQEGHVPGGGDIGVDLSDLTPALIAATGAQHGAIVTFVKPTGPAASALRVGDVVETVNDAPVYSSERLLVDVARASPGARVALGIVRGRQPVQVTVAVGAGAAGAPADATATRLGLILRDAPKAGAEVLGVLPDSAASEAGFEPGDLITSLDDKRMPASAEIEKTFSAARSGDYLLAGVARRTRHAVLALRRP